jgi:GTP pyrophosphokinase
MVCRAIETAETCHSSQRRDGGEPYIVHPLRVALHFLAFADEPVTQEHISIAVLHDVLEDDHTMSVESLATHFTPEVAEAVDLLSRHTRAKNLTFDEYHHRLLTAPRMVRIIKLCDRLDNMLSLHSCPDAGKIGRYLDWTERRYPELGDPTHPGLSRAIAEVCKVLRSRGFRGHSPAETC